MGIAALIIALVLHAQVVQHRQPAVTRPRPSLARRARW